MVGAFALSAFVGATSCRPSNDDPADTGGGSADATAAPAVSPALPHMRWLLTRDGERRGLVIASDLRRDGDRWSLWTQKAGGASPLVPIERLLPDDLTHRAGLAVNGGFWNEHHEPVGVCAGERGIAATARRHAGGFALTDAPDGGVRAWIGPLSARVTLAPDPATTPTAPTLTTAQDAATLPINPRRPRRRAPSLFDPRARTRPIETATPCTVVRLRLDAPNTHDAPLRFNTRVGLTVEDVTDHPADTRLRTPPDEGVVVLTLPHDAPEAEGRIPAKDTPRPRPGDRYLLDPQLSPVRGTVRLATCAGPLLVHEGRRAAVGDGSRQRRHRRTVVGHSADGRRLWIVLLTRGRDGQPGATYDEAAQVLIDLGATEGLNLDGGTSTCLWLGPAAAADLSDNLSAARAALRALLPSHPPIHHGLHLDLTPR